MKRINVFASVMRLGWVVNLCVAGGRLPLRPSEANCRDGRPLQLHQEHVGSSRGRPPDERHVSWARTQEDRRVLVRLTRFCCPLQGHHEEAVPGAVRSEPGPYQRVQDPLQQPQRPAGPAEVREPGHPESGPTARSAGVRTRLKQQN